jgi:hypothetical protein
MSDYIYRDFADPSMSKPVRVGSAGIDLTRELPKPARDLYDAGLHLCTGEGRSLPVDRIRVVWWELDTSKAGHHFNGERWQYLPRGKHIWSARRGEHTLPLVSSLWLELSPDEATEAGYGAKVEELRRRITPRELPLRADFMFQQERLYEVHEFEFIRLPARPAGNMDPVERRAWNYRADVAEIQCRYCQRRIGIPGGLIERVEEYLDGTRGSELQLRMAQLYMEAVEQRPRTNERGRNRDIVETILSIPQRESHALACMRRPFQR